VEEKTNILTVQNLEKKFVLNAMGGKTITGCETVNFQVKSGEFLGISGPSGSGKSTIIKCIYRTYLPTAGSIWYRSEADELVDLASASERTVLSLRSREMGYVSQFLRVIPRVPAIDLLSNGLRRQGWDLQQARREAKEYLQMMNIDCSHWEAYPSFFSGGEQQRINLARALITSPRLLLLDEPTASLDANTKQVVIKALKEMKNRGTTMIGIFHDLESMQKLADRVLVMKAGQESSMKIAEVI
jgi:alpha-D-ribose 1-methylphosphonate 5-triphosphate synthase subunit PhnL